MYEQRISRDAIAARSGVAAAAAENSSRAAAFKRCMWCSYACTRSGDLIAHLNVSHPYEYTANEERFKMAIRDKEISGCGGGALQAESQVELGRSLNEKGAYAPAPPADKVRPCEGDSSQPAAVAAKPSAGTTCPHCHVDCLTRKKLMSHIQAVHKAEDEGDEEDDDVDEPRVKVIRLKRSGNGGRDLIESLSAAGVDRISPALGKLLKAIRPEDVGSAQSAAAAASSSSAGSGKVRGSSSSLLSDVRVVAVPSGSLRVADKKYKCFWCNALFRKRGKLMDHIDTFHKDSKQQTEVEAEMLNSAAAARKEISAADGVTKTEPPTRASFVGDGIESSDSHAGPSRRAAPPPKQHSAAPVVARAPCRYVYRAPTYRQKAETAGGEEAADGESGQRGCKFYLSKFSNPLAAGRLQMVSGSGGSNSSAAPGAAALQWSQATFPPTCYFYAGGCAPAPMHYKPAVAAAALDLPYLLLCNGGRPVAPYHEDEGSRARLPIVASPSEAAAAMSHRYARFRSPEEYPLDLSSRSKQ